MRHGSTQDGGRGGGRGIVGSGEAKKRRKVRGGVPQRAGSGHAGRGRGGCGVGGARGRQSGPKTCLATGSSKFGHTGSPHLEIGF